MMVLEGSVKQATSSCGACFTPPTCPLVSPRAARENQLWLAHWLLKRLVLVNSPQRLPVSRKTIRGSFVETNEVMAMMRENDGVRMLGVV